MEDVNIDIDMENLESMNDSEQSHLRNPKIIIYGFDKDLILRSNFASGLSPLELAILEKHLVKIKETVDTDKYGTLYIYNLFPRPITIIYDKNNNLSYDYYAKKKYNQGKNRQGILFSTQINNHDNICPNNKNPVNGWNAEVEHTVKTWASSLEQVSFIYDYVLEKLETYFEIVTLLALIFSTIGTVISAIIVGLEQMDNSDYSNYFNYFNVSIYPDQNNTNRTNSQNIQNTVIKLNIVVFCINAIITILNGTLKIFKWESDMKHINGYIKTLDAEYSVISSELILPHELRKNGTEFIKQHDSAYRNLVLNSPHVSQNYYLTATKNYEKNKSRNMVKFNNR